MTWHKVRGAKWKGRAVRVRLGLDGVELRRDRHHEESAIFVPWGEVLKLAFKWRRRIAASEERARKRSRRNKAVLEEETAFVLAHLAEDAS